MDYYSIGFRSQKDVDIRRLYSVFLSQKEIIFKKCPIIFVFVPL